MSISPRTRVKTRTDTLNTDFPTTFLPMPAITPNKWVHAFNLTEMICVWYVVEQTLVPHTTNLSLKRRRVYLTQNPSVRQAVRPGFKHLPVLDMSTIQTIPIFHLKKSIKERSHRYTVNLSSPCFSDAVSFSPPNGHKNPSPCPQSPTDFEFHRDRPNVRPHNRRPTDSHPRDSLLPTLRTRSLVLPRSIN